MQRFFKQYQGIILSSLLVIALTMLVISTAHSEEIARDLNSKIDEQAKQLETQVSQTKTLQQQLNNADNVISDLTKSVEALEAEKEQLKGDLDSLKNENDDLRKENAELKKKISIAEAKKKAVSVLSVQDSDMTGKTLSVEATAYIAMCSDGCSGVTATGIDVRHRTPKIIAVDPRVIPLGTVVELYVDGKSWGQYVAADKGGKIKGHKIDILMATEKQADNFGRQQVDLKIVGKTKLSAV